MKLRSLIVLSAAVAALAFPALASAAEWTQEGQPITEPEQLVLKGNFGWTVPAFYFSYHCDVNIEATLEPGEGAKGEIDNFETLRETCIGTGGYEGCQIEDNPLEDSINSGSLEASNESILVHLSFLYDFNSPPCPVPYVFEQGDLNMEPIGGTEPIQEVSLSGFMTNDEGLEFPFSGTFEVVEPSIGIN